MMRRHVIGPGTTLIEALAKINALPERSQMTLFAVDSAGHLLGSLTDGDIRRALLAGASLQSPALEAANTRCRAITPATDGQVAFLRQCRHDGIYMVPQLDADGVLTDIINLRITPTRLPLRAILMAGGKGERLRPLTLDTPKPLLTIEGKAIIDYNIEALAAAGITDINVTVNYLAHRLEQHFATPVAGVQVRCLREDKPLGTIGAAALVPPGHYGATLVMNSDLLTTISFEDLYLQHAAAGNDITIAVIPYQVAVPYAILTLDGDRVTGLDEKPTYSYYANAGIYLFADRLLASLPTDRRTDATDLIEQTIAQGGRVGYFPIKGTWIDIGSPVDFRQAAELMRHHKSLKSID